jgi:hypothetical protein
LRATAWHGYDVRLAAFLVFAQAEHTVIPLDTLDGQARANFAARLSLLGPVAPSAAGRSSPKIRVEVAAWGERAVFLFETRAVLPDDVARARDAEQRGRAAGMGDLAARCRSVWSVDAESDAPEWLVLELCALLAFAALGPVLPPDGSTLLGVRSARERAERLRSTKDSDY